MTPLELAGRAASLVLVVALTANTLLVAVSPDNTVFEYAIVALSSITSIGMLTRMLWPLHRAAPWAAMASAAVWALTFLNLGVAHRGELDPWYSVRQGGFFLSFFLASLSLYFVERRRLAEVALEEEPLSDRVDRVEAVVRARRLLKRQGDRHAHRITGAASHGSGERDQ